MPTRRQEDMEPSRPKHVQSSRVSPEEGCYNMSGSFRTDYHIDFTGSCGLVIWVCAADHMEDEDAPTRQDDAMCGLLCVAICRGTMSDDTLPCRHLMMSSTAWRRYARLRAADHLKDEEAVCGGQRHNTTTWATFCAVAQWCGDNI